MLAPAGDLRGECGTAEASNAQITAVLATSPFSRNATEAATYDVYLVNAYSESEASLLRDLMFMLKQGVLAGHLPWLPVLEAWVEQPASAGAAAGCATLAASHRPVGAGPQPSGQHGWSTARTLAEQLACGIGPRRPCPGASRSGI